MISRSNPINFLIKETLQAVHARNFLRLILLSTFSTKLQGTNLFINRTTRKQPLHHPNYMETHIFIGKTTGKLTSLSTDLHGNHPLYQPSYMETILLINRATWKPSSLSTELHGNHPLYQPSYMLTILFINRATWKPSSLSTELH